MMIFKNSFMGIDVSKAKKTDKTRDKVYLIRIISVKTNHLFAHS